MSKARIIELQRQVKIARGALERISKGCRSPGNEADEALYAMLPLDPKLPPPETLGQLKGPRK